jgi:hypothetical protein
MADLSLLHNVLCRSIQLWGKGQHGEALKLLDESIAKAKRENDNLWIKPLCVQASLIAESMGDLQLVKHYSAEILSHEPRSTLQKAMTLYMLADASFRQNEPDAAKRHAAQAYALVVQSSAKEDRELLQLLTKRWPDVGDWKG